MIQSLEEILIVKNNKMKNIPSVVAVFSVVKHYRLIFEVNLKPYTSACMFSFSNYERLICDNGNIFQQIASIFLLQRLLSKARERSQPSLQAGVGSFISVLRKKTDVMQLAGRRSR